MQPDFSRRVALLLGWPEQYRPHNAYGGRVDWSTDQLAEAAGNAGGLGVRMAAFHGTTIVRITTAVNSDGGFQQYHGTGPTLRAAIIAALTAYFAAVPENENDQ